MGLPYHIWFTMPLLPHWLEAPLSHVLTPNVLTAVKLKIKTWALIFFFTYQIIDPSALFSVSSSGFSFCRLGPCLVFVDADGFLCLTRLFHAIRWARIGCGVTLAPDHANTISVWCGEKTGQTCTSRPNVCLNWDLTTSILHCQHLLSAAVDLSESPTFLSACWKVRKSIVKTP